MAWMTTEEHAAWRRQIETEQQKEGLRRKKWIRVTNECAKSEYALQGLQGKASDLEKQAEAMRAAFTEFSRLYAANKPELDDTDLVLHEKERVGAELRDDIHKFGR